MDHKQEQQKKSDQARKEGVSALSYLRDQVDQTIRFVENTANKNLTPDQLDWDVYGVIINSLTHINDVVKIQRPIFVSRMNETYMVKNWPAKKLELVS